MKKIYNPLKSYRGSVTNVASGVTKDIIVSSRIPVRPLPLIIGVAAMVFGMSVLTVSAFRKGALIMEKAEMGALAAAGLLSKGK